MEQLRKEIDSMIDEMQKIMNKMKVIDYMISTSRTEKELEEQKQYMINIIKAFKLSSQNIKKKLNEWNKIEVERGLPVNLNYRRLYKKLG